MDFTLTEEQNRWRAVARNFAEHSIKPDVLRRDRLPTAKERIPWDWIRQADRLGLRTLGVPMAYGGGGAGILTMCVVGEELAAGDLGFAVILDQCWKMAHILGEAMTPEQQKRFIPPFVADPAATLAIGFTEEGAGSDHQGYYDSPDIDFRTTAVRDGDSYVINGMKRYVSNGCMAMLYFVVARSDPSKPLREGGSVFIVPSDAPGFRAGFFHEKSSQRLATNGTFYLENCRVPVGNLLGGEGLMSRLRGQFMWGSKVEAAATVLGGAAIMYDHPIEKYLRDAASFLHSDGTNQICLLRAAQGLTSQDAPTLYGF